MTKQHMKLWYPALWFMSYNWAAKSHNTTSPSFNKMIYSLFILNQQLYDFPVLPIWHKEIRCDVSSTLFKRGVPRQQMQAAKQPWFLIILKMFLKTALRMMFKCLKEKRQTHNCVTEARPSNEDEAFRTAQAWPTFTPHAALPLSNQAAAQLLKNNAANCHSSQKPVPLQEHHLLGSRLL